MGTLHATGLSYRRIARVSNVPVATIHGRQYRARHAATAPPAAEGADTLLVAWITAVKEVRSTWGTRRVRAFLVKRGGFPGLGRKRVQRLMRLHKLLCPRSQKRVHRQRPERTLADAPNRLWATDMTSLMLTTLQRLYLVVVLDVCTRRIVGWHLSTRCRSREWMLALEQAIHHEFPDGVRNAGLILRSDNGSQPTSKAYGTMLETLHITGEYIGFNCPEQNGHVERVIGTLKQDFLWLEEYDTFGEAYQMVQRAVNEYNSDHPHSALLYLSPNECKRAWDQGRLKINENQQLEITQKAA